jgi:hypothetical protein
MRVAFRSAVVLAALATGCRPQSSFECTVDAQCSKSNVQGTCEENGFCSFPDPTCPSGRRFGDLAGDLANMCVPSQFDTDEPMSTSNPDPSSSSSTTGASETTPAESSSSGDTSTSTTSTTGAPCEESCLDYQPQWQIPIQNSFVDLARLPSGSLLLVGSYVDAVSIGAIDLVGSGDVDLYLAWLEGENVVDVVAHPSDGNTHVLGVANDPSGRIYVSGAYTGAPDFGGPALPDSSGGGYVVGFEANGDHRWTVPMNPGRTWEVEHFGNSVIAVGDFQGSTTLGAETLMSAGSSDAFIVRLHEDGNVLLHHHIAGPDLDIGSDVIATGGGYVAIGMFSEMLSGGGDTVSVQGTVDGWVQRLSTGAMPEWTRSFGGGLVQWPYVDADAAGNLYVIAMFEGTLQFDDGTSYESTVSDDIVIAKLAPDGAHEWSQAIATAGASRSWAVDANADGRVAFGFSYGSATTVAGQDFVSAGANDGILVVYDTDGAPQWVTTYSGPLDETGCAVLLEDNDDITAIFTYQSASIDIGLGPAPGPGNGMNYAALVVYYPAPE